ncbi:amino acid permease [Rhodococcus sp. X156]|uniref:amino acid permease n=1 Tax=Rhodococcus sp. X156 TaxID=2499145 RepID=UPI000FD765B0|nr:amino acid permease [Rhodococcus sp. X156]
MTATLPSLAPPATQRDDLGEFGYEQQLHRKLGSFASFAAGFSFISVLTTVFQLAGLGFSFGGPAFIWAWPLVLGGQLLVALCFAELAARFPISGAIYQWTTRMSNSTYGWFAGWIMIVGQTVVMTAAAIALQVVLPSVWSGFQVIGDDPDITSTSGAQNAMLLAGGLIVATTVINIIGVRLMAVVNNVGVTCEIVGALVIIGLLLTHTNRGTEVVFDLGSVSSSGYFGAFLCASFTAAYVMIGFDSAGELSEETRDARRVAPRTMLRALLAAGLLGGALLMALLLAAPSLTDGRFASEGPAYVISALFTGLTGHVLLLMVAIAICVATLAVQTSGSRMLFSMARDGKMPLAKTLAHVPSSTGTPVYAATAIGLGAIGVLALNLGPHSAFINLESTCIALVYLAYLMLTTAMLVQRLRGNPLLAAHVVDEQGAAVFSLGRWGLPVNVAAVLYGLAMLVNLAWPRQEIYDPEGGSWYMQYFAILFTLGTAAVGVLLYWASQRRPEPVAEPVLAG